MSDEPQRPTSDDNREGWKVYWAAQAMPWRTEAEIGEERQIYLSERRSVNPDVERGIYPFRGENGSIGLTRADVEWLLATHESSGMRGPVNWDIELERKREGLDLRGANLRGVDLTHLPLARMRGGLDFDERANVSFQKREMAAVQLQEADLSAAHFEYAILSRAHLDSVVMRGTDLTRADLFWSHLEGATLTEARLQGADLAYASLDSKTYMRGVILAANGTHPVSLAGVRWGGADLSLIDWTQLKTTGEEQRARESGRSNGKSTFRGTYIDGYEAAVRANRQLANLLRAQGLYEDADRFAYRAQMLQRRVLLRRKHFTRCLGSLLLDWISGYGYRPLRSFVAYGAMISAFAGAYFLNAQFAAPHLTWDESLVLSISSFHGRGFFSSGISLGDTLARLAAGEAIIGLLIEITFIATFTQRFFAR